MRAEDLAGIQAALVPFGRDGMWTVVRRGRANGPVRVLYCGRQLKAIAAFTSARQRMRQGMLALVDPSGRVDRYVSEPMVRTRW